jgi:hypothetical protein
MRRRTGTSFNGPQRAVDAMAAGQDPNADRRKKAAEYGMAGDNAGVPDLSKSRTKTPAEVYQSAKDVVMRMRRRVLGG